MKILKVTDPAKKVTDPVVFRELERQGINKDYVEFHEDYSRKHPYAKTYKNLKSNKMFQVISGLPKIRKNDGVKIEVGWDGKNGKFTAKPNLFSAFVNHTKIDVTVLNDQSNGAEAGDSVSWEPQLFIGDEEIHPVNESAILLDVDPVNENYSNNTLEWDYGVCKRRLRIIEGRIREKWVFAEKPEGKIKIKHNQVGDFRLRLGSGIDANGEPLNIVVENEDEEVFSGDAEYPIEIGASLIVYPDADIEKSSVDGPVAHYALESDWNVFPSGAGTWSDDDRSAPYFAYGIQNHTTTDKYTALYRSIFLFDTSSLGAKATIIDATFSLYIDSSPNNIPLNQNTTGWAYMVLVSSNPATNVSLCAGDFDSLGTTQYMDHVRADGFTDNQYNDYPLNTNGKAAINKSGVTKFGTREEYYDICANTPYWSYNTGTYASCYYAEKGSGYKPKLVVTYKLGHPISLRKRGRILGLGTNRPW